MSGPVRHRYNLRSRQNRPSDILSQRPVRHRYNLRSNAARVGSPPVVENNRVPAMQTPTSNDATAQQASRVPAMQTPASPNASAMQANDVPDYQTSSVPESQTPVTPSSLVVPDAQVPSAASQIASDFVHHTPSASAMQARVPAMQTPTAVVRPVPVERDEEEERPLQRRRLSQGGNQSSGEASVSGPSDVIQLIQQQLPQQPTSLSAGARAARSGCPTARRGGGGRRVSGVARRGGRGRIGEEEGQRMIWQNLGNGGFRRMTEDEAARWRWQQQRRVQLREQRVLEQQQQQQQEQQQQPQQQPQQYFNVDRSTLCSICIDPFEDGGNGRQLPCGHVFHTDCIDEWLMLKNICPNCRRPTGYN